jgi:isochorismate synthase EntC
MELAERLTRIQGRIREDARTAQALLEGTKFEREARIWVNQILRALEATGIDSPAISMNRTIARLREPFLGGRGPD